MSDMAGAAAGGFILVAKVVLHVLATGSGGSADPPPPLSHRYLGRGGDSVWVSIRQFNRC